MESFNKNWLAIILIAIVFAALGFIFGWIMKPDSSCCNNQKPMMEMMKMHGCGSPEMLTMPIDDATADSLGNIDVDVTVTKDGNVLKDADKKVIVKKIAVGK